MFQTIIIADDSATARMVTKRCLEIAGYQQAIFLEARNGAEALEIAKKSAADLLVTDLNMPEMDGTTLLKRIKASPRTTDLPVLVVSSLSNPAKEAELLALGAFAVLSKPISPAVIAGILGKLMEQPQWGQL
ncbi:MAG: response regulator [bacterium]|nr:response regulator [bacterium]